MDRQYQMTYKILLLNNIRHNYILALVIPLRVKNISGSKNQTFPLRYLLIEYLNIGIIQSDRA